MDKRAIAERPVKVSYDAQSGFIGTKVSGEATFECSNLEKLLLLYSDGSYRVISIPEKQYVHAKAANIVYIGIADKKTVFSAIYTDLNGYPYAKRFIVKQFILDKEYTFLEEGQKLEYLSGQEKVLLELNFKPKPKQKVSTLEFTFVEVSIKGVNARGIRIANKELKKIKMITNGG